MYENKFDWMSYCPSMIAARTIAIVAAVSAASAATYDGRSFRKPGETTFSVRTDIWKRVQQSLNSDGWLERNLRCSRSSFEIVVLRVTSNWSKLYSTLHSNTVFSIRDRVAVTLHYLTHSDGFAASGQVFGMSQTRTHEYVTQVTAVILTYLSDAVHFPRTTKEWIEVSDGFESARRRRDLLRDYLCKL